MPERLNEHQLTREATTNPTTRASLGLSNGVVQSLLTYLTNDGVNPAVLMGGRQQFLRFWASHPHNYQERRLTSIPIDQIVDEAFGEFVLPDSPDTSSKDVLSELGFPQNWNTCAVRMSVMLNRSGQHITPEKAKAAGLRRLPRRSRRTGRFYILGAVEMMQYLQAAYRAPDLVFPATGYFEKSDWKNPAVLEPMKDSTRDSAGIVGFEHVFGYSGSGHVDLFHGHHLSDSERFYPCRRMLIWKLADVPV